MFVKLLIKLMDAFFKIFLFILLPIIIIILIIQAAVKYPIGLISFAFGVLISPLIFSKLDNNLPNLLEVGNKAKTISDEFKEKYENILGELKGEELSLKAEIDEIKESRREIKKIYTD